MDKVILCTIICKVQTRTLNQFCSVFLGHLRPGFKDLFNYSFPGKGYQNPTFSKLMEISTKPWIIHFRHSYFKWRIPSNTHLMLECILFTHLEWLCYLKTKSDFIVRSVETGLGRSVMLVVAVIGIDAYPTLVSQTWPVTLKIQE